MKQLRLFTPPPSPPPPPPNPPDADNINSCLELVWGKKLFEKIKNICFRKRFFYNLFWIILSNQPKLKRIINNFRRHQYAKRLFEKI